MGGGLGKPHNFTPDVQGVYVHCLVSEPNVGSHVDLGVRLNQLFGIRCGEVDQLAAAVRSEFAVHLEPNNRVDEFDGPPDERGAGAEVEVEAVAAVGSEASWSVSLRSTTSVARSMRWLRTLPETLWVIDRTVQPTTSPASTHS